MKKVTMYKAFDDMIFNTEKECHEYETKRCNEMIDAIKQIKEICVNNGEKCNGCIFHTGAECIMAQMTWINNDAGYPPCTWTGDFKLD